MIGRATKSIVFPLMLQPDINPGQCIQYNLSLLNLIPVIKHHKTGMPFTYIVRISAWAALLKGSGYLLVRHAGNSFPQS